MLRSKDRFTVSLRQNGVGTGFIGANAILPKGHALPALAGDGRSSLRRGGRIEGGLSVEDLGEPAPLAIDTVEASERDYDLVSPPCFPLSLFSPLPVFPSPCFPL